LSGSEFSLKLRWHDESKLSNTCEAIPGIIMTWQSKLRKEGSDFVVPDNIEEMIRDARIHRVINNDHHYEYYFIPGDINQPSHGSRISDTAIAEMCSDWFSTSIEYSMAVSKSYEVKWIFSEYQQGLITKYLNDLWSSHKRKELADTIFYAYIQSQNDDQTRSRLTTR